MSPVPSREFAGQVMLVTSWTSLRSSHLSPSSHQDGQRHRLCWKVCSRMGPWMIKLFLEMVPCAPFCFVLPCTSHPRNGMESSRPSSSVEWKWGKVAFRSALVQGCSHWFGPRKNLSHRDQLNPVGLRLEAPLVAKSALSGKSSWSRAVFVDSCVLWPNIVLISPT